MTNTSGSMWLLVEAPGVRAPWGFPCVWMSPTTHRRRIPCRQLLVCVVLLAIALVERGVFIVVGLSGLWRVDGECGVVSVADAGVLTVVAESVARDGVVPGVFVDSCAGLFFRVLRALDCRVGGDVALALSCGVRELVEASLGVDGGGEASGAGDTDVDGHDGVSVDAWVRRLAQVGEVVWGAACAVAYGDGVEVEAVRLLADARQMRQARVSA